jgi:hypothetical protein
MTPEVRPLLGNSGIVGQRNSNTGSASTKIMRLGRNKKADSGISGASAELISASLAARRT